METRKPIDPLAGGLMLVICMIWGLQQVVIKIAAEGMAPIVQTGLRSGLAAVLVAALIRLNGGRIVLRDGSWQPGLLAGLLFALEYLFVGEGLRFTTASHMVVFLYTAPIFTALLLHWRLPEERLKPIQWAGIGLAFAGIVLTFVDRGPVVGLASAPNMVAGDVLGLAGGFCWGLTTLVLRSSRLSVIPAANTLLYQLIGAFVLLTFSALVLGRTEVRLTSIVVAGLSFQVLIICFASFLAWFWLLRHYLASRLGVLSFLTPLFGVAFGVLLLNEPLEMNFILGSLMVLAGVILVSGYEWVQHRLEQTRECRESF